jgi:hypothetical protein
MFVLLDAIDGVCAMVLPVGARVALYGLILGALSMLVYWRLAPQVRLRTLKQQVSDGQKALRTYNGTDPRELMRLCKGAIGPAVKQLVYMIGPVLLGMAPVLLVATWLEARFTYRLPIAGETVDARILPAEASRSARWEPADAVDPGATPGSYSLRWPEAGKSLVLNDSTDGQVVLALPTKWPTNRAQRPSRWRTFLEGKDRVDLPQAGAVEAVEMDLPEMRMWSAGPRWLAAWYVPFTVALAVAALGMKFWFKIV